MFTEAYLEPSRTSMMELFSLPLNQNVLNSIKLLLGCIFYITHFFAKKLTTVKISGEKVFC